MYVAGLLNGLDSGDVMRSKRNRRFFLDGSDGTSAEMKVSGRERLRERREGVWAGATRGHALRMGKEKVNCR
jgi:hypothetical protein